jgi:hypothetical protein
MENFFGEGQEAVIKHFEVYISRNWQQIPFSTIILRCK